MIDTGWLRGLCDLALTWSKDPSNGPASPETQAYIQLIFAYGLARAGDNGASNQLLDAAGQVLAAGDAVHRSLLKAYGYRIRMAQEGLKNTGPLPAEAVLKNIGPLPQEDFLALLKDRMNHYSVDRLRQHSRILEPEQQIDAYRPWVSAEPGSLWREMYELTDLTNREQIVKQTNRLLHTRSSTSKEGQEARVLILSTALNLAPRVGKEFALDM